jgi:Tol biopolymer transport system component
MGQQRQSAEKLFCDALNMEPEARRAFLDAACHDEPELKHLIEQLLMEDERAGSFLNKPLFDSSTRTGIHTHTLPLTPGTRLGPYEILAAVGAGGMGEVYRARDTRLGRDVAVKILLTQLSFDPDLHERFLREAKCVSALQHPNICVLYDIGSQDGIDFIVMEYIAGQTLDKSIPAGGLAANLSIEYALQVAAALSSAHAAGIVHRDLKPSNIMIEESGLVKVLDFGLAKLAAPATALSEAATLLTMPGLVVGTIAYMSPEQAEGKPTNARSDIFSFGAVLYEMLSGKKAFPGQSSAAVIRDEPTPLNEVRRDVPAEVHGVVTRCLKKDPAARYASGAELAHDLKVCREVLFPESGAVLSPARIFREARRPRVWVPLLVTAIILAAGAIWLVNRYRDARWAREVAVLDVRPFTALPGEETSPAFSPDGSRIAFAWNGDPAPGAKGFDLYVKAMGSETLLRLTRHPSEWISPAWSPDGTQIAFHRIDGSDTGIFVVPALGGAERKLHATRIPWANFTVMSWSPDGKWIAFSDLLPDEEHAMIYFLSTETLEIKRIPNSPKCLGQGQPAFSHRGDYLAYWCFRSYDEFAVCSLSLATGQPKVFSIARPRTDFAGFPNGLNWLGNDRALIYSLGVGLGEVTVTNGSVKPLAFAENAVWPTVSSKVEKLAFSSSSNSQNIWRRDLLRPTSPAVEVIPSTRGQGNAQYSPDGKRIAFASERSGVQGVWVSSDDGSNLVQISNPHHVSGSPQWSPDGKKIAFDSHPLGRWEIYVADVTEGIPKKLVTNISGVYGPHWSRDGKWIYFRSSEVGRAGLYRCPASGGDAIALSKDIDGGDPQESFDGKTVYFQSQSVLKRIALLVQPRTESVVEGFRTAGLWTLSSGGIYFVPADAPKSVCYFDFASQQIRPIFEVDKDFGDGLSISPDGRWIIYSQIADVNSDIMLVDRFH